MKKIIKKFLSVIQIPIKLLLIAVMVFYSYEYLNKVFINKEVSYGGEYRSLPENSLDVLVLGSSDAQYSFVPGFFFQDTGLYSFVRGTPCQPMEVSYQILKDSLKTQKPKIVLLEVFTAMPLRKICEDDACYVTAQYQMTGKEKYDTINYLPEEKAREYRNDFINYHNDWRTMDDYKSLLPQNVFKDENKLTGYFGYVYQYGDIADNYWFPVTYQNDIEVELDELDEQSLNNIYNLCKENDIELILYKTPIDGLSQEDQSTLHKVWEWADSNNVKYVDFLSLAPEMKFYMNVHSDSFHCNINGASMLTGYLSDLISNTYSIEHKQNDQLDELYESTNGWFNRDAINTESNPLVYLRRLKNLKGVICIRYVPYQTKKINQDLYDEMCSMGCSHFDSNYDYYAIFKDGELIIDDYNLIEYEIDDKKISINKETIQMNEERFDTQAPISILYINSKDKDSLVYKNIDYIPFPWDKDNVVYTYR